MKDKTMRILGDIMCNLQRVQMTRTKAGNKPDAGIDFAYRCVMDHYNRYVEEKAKRNPFWRFLVWLKFQISRRKLRNI